MLYIVLACLFGLMMTWSVGANDLANVMSTTMGSRAISVRNALIIAVVFEFAGASWGSSDVSNTLRNGIINIQLLNNTPDILMFGMLAVLLSGTVWMIFASHFGLPVSVTNTIVGAIVGFGLIVLGPHALHWQQIATIALTWVISPTSAGVVAYFLFISIQQMILATDEPLQNAKRYAPIYLFFIGIVLAIMIIVKGLKHFHIALATASYLEITIATGVLVMVLGAIGINRMVFSDEHGLRSQFASTERIFGVLMGLTACAMVFAHGSNDVAIAVGPMASVITIAASHGQILYVEKIPEWITLLGATGVIFGLFMFGRKVIETVGNGITQLTPSRAFSATLSAASVVIIATSLGIPVSATQTLVGAILGVGLARGLGALNLRVVRNIFMSWIITIPMGATLAILFYYMFIELFRTHPIF